MKWISLLIFLSIIYTNSIAQVSAGPNDTICENESTVLQGSSQGNYEYTWTSSPPDLTISNPNILTPTVSPSELTTYTLTGKEVTDVNLISNYDFQQGYTGFTSEYDYCDVANCLNAAPPTGGFGINSNPSFLHNGFPSCGDHTGGGNMMVANGDEFNDITFYETTVSNISPNTDYEFSIWLTSMGAFFTATLQFEINGTVIGTKQASTVTCQWNEFSAVWSSGSATSAVIKIINITTVLTGWGNDFAIDDIALFEIIEHTDQCVVKVNQIPTSTFDLQPSVCINDTTIITYTGNASGSAYYNWDFGTDILYIEGSNEGPYKILWNNPGTQTISLWVESECVSATTTKDISIIDKPDIELTADNTSIPYGTSTSLHGEIISPSFVSFLWEPLEYLENPIDLEPKTTPLVAPTTFYFHVTDNIEGCSNTDSILIDVIGGPISILSTTAFPDTICNGESSTIALTVTGGSQVYSANWTSDPSGFSHTGPELSLPVSPLETTTYLIDVNDGYDTLSSSINVVVINDTYIVNQPIDQTLISGTSASFSIDSEFATFFQWQISYDNGITWVDLSNGSEYSGVLSQNLTINPVTNIMNGNMFRCNISGNCNNIISTTASLTVYDSPDFISNLSNNEICEGDNVSSSCMVGNFVQITQFDFSIEYDNSLLEFTELVDITTELVDDIVYQVSGTTINISWLSTQGITIGDGEIFKISFKALANGTSDISWDTQNNTVINQVGVAPDLILSNGRIIINPLPTPVDLISSSTDTVNVVDEIKITLTAVGGSGNTLVWALDNCNGDTVAIGSPIEITRPITTSNYYAYWVNQCGKSTCLSTKITILYDFEVGFPNAFTPNSDGNNDEFNVVSNATLINFNLQIFNRNGLLIFETNDQYNGWDGTYKNDRLSTGTYVWKVSYNATLTGSNVEVVTKTGTVTLIN